MADRTSKAGCSANEIRGLYEVGMATTTVRALGVLLKGGKGASKYDLYKDGKGNIYVKRKGGGGEADPTGLNSRDYPEL